MLRGPSCAPVVFSARSKLVASLYEGFNCEHMPELRKRKSDQVESPQVKRTKQEIKEIDSTSMSSPTASSGILSVGDHISSSDFGGEVTTNEGHVTSFHSLLAESANGVIIFTYPKASTPGCIVSSPALSIFTV